MKKTPTTADQVAMSTHRLLGHKLHWIQPLLAPKTIKCGDCDLVLANNFHPEAKVPGVMEFEEWFFKFRSR